MKSIAENSMLMDQLVRNIRRVVFLSAVTASFSFLAPAAQGAVIPVLNGSFEYPGNGSEWQYLPPVSANSGWVNPDATSQYVIYNAGSGGGYWFSSAADGQYLLNTPNGTTSQDLNTILGLHNEVTLTFSVAQTNYRANGAIPSISYGQGTVIAEIFSGATMIGSGSYSATAGPGNWSSITPLTALVTTPGDISIRFVNGTSLVSTDAPWLDDVTVTYEVVAVPEPSTWAMLLLGLGGLAIAVRRRQLS